MQYKVLHLRIYSVYFVEPVSFFGDVRSVSLKSHSASFSVNRIWRFLLSAICLSILSDIHW